MRLWPLLPTLTAALFLVAAAAPGQVTELYRLKSRAAAVPELSPAAVRAIGIEPISPGLLRSHRSTLTLPMPGGTTLLATPAGFEDRGPSFTWRGRIVRSDGGEGMVILTVHKGLLSGAIFSPPEVWILRPRSDRSHLLVEVSQDRLPGCGVGFDALGWEMPAVPPLAGRLPGTVMVDVLALYTPGARAGAGGVDQIEALILNAAGVANAAFAASGVDGELRVVHFAEVDPAAYGPLASLEEALLALQGDPAVAAARDAWGADLVAAVFESGAGLCGFAHAMDAVGAGFAADAYSITVRDCAVANLSFAHEIAHNLGCRHNPEDSDAAPGEASFPWSFGHYVPGNFRTVMALATPCGAAGCPRLPGFSHPQVLLGAPQLPSGIDGERDNHRTLAATFPVAAGFRTAVRIFSDGFESGDLRSWSP